MNLNCYKYSESDLNAFKLLFEEAFERPYRLESFHWQYLNNPEGFLMSLVKDNENNYKLAGTSAGVIFNSVIGDKKGYCCRVQNSMVSKDYKGQGLFKKTIDDLTTQFFQDKGDYMLAFLTRDIPRHTFKSMNFTDFLVYTYQFCLNKDDLPLINNEVRVDEIINFNEEDELLISKYLSNYQIHIERNREYLNWRFNTHPEKKYFVLRLYENNILIALLICKIFQTEIDIVDYFSVENNKKSFMKITDNLQHFAVKSNCNKLNIWSTSHYSYHNDLLEYGFSKTIQSTQISLKFKNIEPKLKFEYCYFSYSDSDIY